jgi:hypothetical protein
MGLIVIQIIYQNLECLISAYFLEWLISFHCRLTTSDIECWSLCSFSHDIIFHDKVSWFKCILTLLNLIHRFFAFTIFVTFIRSTWAIWTWWVILIIITIYAFTFSTSARIFFTASTLIIGCSFTWTWQYGSHWLLFECTEIIIINNQNTAIFSPYHMLSLKTWLRWLITIIWRTALFETAAAQLSFWSLCRFDILILLLSQCLLHLSNQCLCKCLVFRFHFLCTNEASINKLINIAFIYLIWTNFWWNRLIKSWSLLRRRSRRNLWLFMWLYRISWCFLFGLFHWFFISIMFFIFCQLLKVFLAFSSFLLYLLLYFLSK